MIYFVSIQQEIAEVSSSVKNNLPATVDWRNIGAVTAVGDQSINESIRMLVIIFQTIFSQKIVVLAGHLHLLGL